MTDWDDKTELDVMSLVTELVEIEGSRGATNGTEPLAAPVAFMPPSLPVSAASPRAQAPRVTTLTGVAAPSVRKRPAAKNLDFAEDEVTRVYLWGEAPDMSNPGFSAEGTRLFETVDARTLRRNDAPPPPPPRERAAVSRSAPPPPAPLPPRERARGPRSAPPSLPTPRQAATLAAASDATQASSRTHLAQSPPTPGELTASAGAHSVVRPLASRGLSARALPLTEPTIIAPASASPSSGAPQMVGVQRLPMGVSGDTPAHSALTVAVATPGATVKPPSKARPGWLLKVAVVAAVVASCAAVLKLRSGKPAASGKDRACVALGTCARVGGAAVVASAAEPPPVPALGVSALDPMAGPAFDDATPHSASGKLAQGDLEGALRSYRTLARREPANESYRTLVSVLFRRMARSVEVAEGG